jgi:ribosomal protein S18 acetylase RimI-like enzyme
MTCATDQVLRAQPMQSSATGLNLIAPGAERIAPWRPELYDAAAELIYLCYVHHIDATINDQYTSVNGSRRFLHNVVRFPGCGVFDGRHSLVLHAETPGAIDGLLLCSRVDTGVAHITQLCLSPAARGRGMARLMMERCAAELRADGVTRLQLTVTEANSSACRLYRSMGFEVRHRFDAMAWNDPDH